MFYFILFLVLFGLIALAHTRSALYLIMALLPVYLVRTQIASIPTTFLELAIYLVFLVWLAKASLSRTLGQKTKRILSMARPIFIPLILFFTAAVLSTVFSPDKRLSLGVLKGWFFDPLLVFFLVLDQVRNKRHINRIIISLFLCAAWVSLYGVYEFLRGTGLDSDGRLNSVFIPANYVALLIAPISVLALLFFKKIKEKRVRLAYYILLLIILFALFLTKSYGGWLGFACALAFLWFWVRVPYKRLQYLATFALIVIILSLFLSQSPKFGRLFEFGYRTSSATRSQIWKTSVLIIKQHPFQGVGLGNFESVYREYVPYVAFPPLEWLVVKPHNLFLNLWIETGVLGLVSFVFLCGLLFGHGVRLLLRNRAHRIAKYALAGLLCLLMHGAVDTPYFKNDLSVLFWVLVGIIIITLSYANGETALAPPQKNH